MHEKMCMFKNLLLMYDFLCPTHFRIELIYVRILSEQSTAIYNFPFWQLLTSSIYNTFNIVSFIKGLATIVPKGNPNRNIGQRGGMSEGDAAELRKYYNCLSKWNNQIKIINCGKYTTFKTLTLYCIIVTVTTTKIQSKKVKKQLWWKLSYLKEFLKTLAFTSLTQFTLFLKYKNLFL